MNKKMNVEKPSEPKRWYYKTPRGEGIIGDGSPFEFAGKIITKELIETTQEEIEQRKVGIIGFNEEEDT